MHGKNIECCSNVSNKKRERESEIWKPAKYDGGTCTDEKMRME